MAILLVDDDNNGRRVAVYTLRKAGLEVDEAADGAAALQVFDPTRHHVVVTDLKMPGVRGLEVLATIRRRAPEVPVIVMTAFGGVDVAVEAMRSGAFHFLEKPFSRDALTLTVQRALETRELRAENARLRAGQRVERPMVASSPSMQAALSLVDRIAPSDATVLITGESGTGKELVARRLHGRSARRERSFVAVNCAAIPHTLLESELFGHEKGAFTGAIRARPGHFRQADGGTLFLDEIGELPLALQPKLLRVLQEGVVTPVGGDGPIEIDVRIVAATNQDLESRVSQGAFRQDLFYRLDVIRIELPSLQQRPEDILLLARTFIDEFRGKRELTLGRDVARALQVRSWPGNVRELRNACERMALLAPADRVRVQDLPPIRRRLTTESDWVRDVPPDLSLADVEAQLIRHVLGQTGWNVSKAARRLSVPRHVLAYRIQKYSLLQEP
jgi:two-component system NtrC family response regulator